MNFLVVNGRIKFSNMLIKQKILKNKKNVEIGKFYFLKCGI